MRFIENAGEGVPTGIFYAKICYDHAVDDVFLIIQLFQRRDWVQRHAAVIGSGGPPLLCPKEGGKEVIK